MAALTATAPSAPVGPDAPGAGDAAVVPEASGVSLYDVQRLKRDHPLADVAARRYGVSLRASGRALVGYCPLPKHDDRAKPNFYVYPQADPAEDNWFCYRCNVGGDVIRLVQLIEGVDFAEACARLVGPGAAPDAYRLPASAVPTARTGRPRSSPTPPQADQVTATAAPPAATAEITPTIGSGVARTVPAAAVVLRESMPADEQAAQRNWERLGLDEQVVMNTACAIYQHCLWRNSRALAYLRARGLPYSAIKECGLGYADGHTLEEYLRRRGGLRVAQELGLLRRGSTGDGARGALGAQGAREFLAGRIVVPEFRGGQAIWFIGRTIGIISGAPGRSARFGRQGPEDRRPKYLALPGDRPLLGYERAAGRREAVLCEGVLDYVTAVAWKLAAFSPCGTHVPPERLAFLSHTDRVYGVFDADDAGWEASARLAELLGERWRPLALPDGTDLNDLATRPGGAGTFFRLLAAAREAPTATTTGRSAPPPTDLRPDCVVTTER